MGSHYNNLGLFSWLYSKKDFVLSAQIFPHMKCSKKFQAPSHSFISHFEMGTLERNLKKSGHFQVSMERVEKHMPEVASRHLLLVVRIM